MMTDTSYVPKVTDFDRINTHRFSATQFDERFNLHVPSAVGVPVTVIVVPRLLMVPDMTDASQAGQSPLGALAKGWSAIDGEEKASARARLASMALSTRVKGMDCE